MTSRAQYADTIEEFLGRSPAEVLGALAGTSRYAIEPTQQDAWRDEIEILRAALARFRGRGKLYFEYVVPRLGKRIDVVALIDHVVFVIEFKVGETAFTSHARDQVLDYAVDLKNFHETSHRRVIAPLLVATRAQPVAITIATTHRSDGVLLPVCVTAETLGVGIERVLAFADDDAVIADEWEAGRYSPTPTIVEAAIALYNNHSVVDISQTDASATNLTKTSAAIAEVIRTSKELSRKSICFVTGVPGAGKTLVGLNIATQHIDKESDLYSVFLSGNGPLVAILREALARDQVARAVELGGKLRKGEALSKVKMFIDNVHHFRDECLLDAVHPPIEHVALFDEAQRAWNLEQTAKFMLQKKRRAGFAMSEPEFLISCLDRHPDWAVIVCLVNGGQEINTGEAGIVEWINALNGSFPHWHINVSSRLHDAEYGAGEVIASLAGRTNVQVNDDLHLGVSMRSFRSEHVASLVKHLLDRDVEEAGRLLGQIGSPYPIVLTRNLQRAKSWLRENARGFERYGMIVSSQAQRLKPHAIDIRSPVNPIHWFLGQKEDVRSSYYLEDVATEFDIQGLELDWGCVVWDGDFRYSREGWGHFSFVGDSWNHIRKPERQTYLKNAYRVLLTRARQGMVIVVPPGDETDPTRSPAFYDPTYNFLKQVGFATI